MEFVASKFNAETDEDRPLIGEEFSHVDGGEVFVIEKVAHTTLGDIMKGENEPEQGEYDEMLVKRHTLRPAVYWIVWGNKKK